MSNACHKVLYIIYSCENEGEAFGAEDFRFLRDFLFHLRLFTNRVFSLWDELFVFSSLLNEEGKIKGKFMMLISKIGFKASNFH